ncbi:hypothetical protein CLU79DRAFT_776520 [Phycomyces nitens]|nr:hypothetical protein CLU79DRAFT_776520 [Phycomyces nitens]
MQLVGQDALSVFCDPITQIFGLIFDPTGQCVYMLVCTIYKGAWCQLTYQRSTTHTCLSNYPLTAIISISIVLAFF